MNERRSIGARPRTLTRRKILGAAGLAVAGGVLPWWRAAAAELPRGDWGAIQELAEGVWAVASTPLLHRDFKTVCNGGLVAGRERVLVIEAFAGRAGAQWVAEAALDLTGRWPTDVVVTHYHGDHTGGLTGLLRGDDRPALHGAPATLDRLGGGDDTLEERERGAMLAAAKTVEDGRPTEIDLGGVTAVIRPYRGHTASDLVIEVPERGIAFAGDLLWSGMIPNFVDARPIELSKTLRAMRALETLFVAGHGSLGESRLLPLNLELTDFLEETARRSFEAGVSPAEAAAGAKLPVPFDSWVAFSANYVERAIAAWHRDLA